MKYIVECKPDKTLIKMLTNAPKKSIIHAANKSEAIKTLLKTKEPSIAVVDEDPGSPWPSVFKSFKLERNLGQCDISVYIEPASGKKLIAIKPKLEEWLIKTGKECNVSFEKHNLPERGEKLHDVINLNIKKLEGILKEMLNIKCLRLSKLKQELRGDM